MAKVKGCLNTDCIEYSKRTKFKEDVFYCSKCGNKLVYICPSCYKELKDRNDKFCEECIEKKNAVKEKRKNDAKAVVGVVKDNMDVVKVVVNKDNVQKAVKAIRKVIK